MWSASPPNHHLMQISAVNEYLFGAPRGHLAAPFAPNMYFVCDVLECVIEAVMIAEVGKVGPRNIAAAAHRSPNEWDAQFPEVSGLAKACDRQLMRGIKTL